MKIFISFGLEPTSFLIYFIVFLFYCLKKDQQFRYQVLCGYYLVVTAMFAREFFVSMDPKSESNTYLYNLLYLITSLALSYYFFSVLQLHWKKIIAIIVGLITLWYYIASDEIFFDSIGHVISSTGIVLLIFLYLHQILSHVTEDPLSLNFDFWFACTQLAYHLGSFAIFLSYNYFTIEYLKKESREVSTILTSLWDVHNVLLFLGSLTTAVGIVWVYRRKSP